MKYGFVYKIEDTPLDNFWTQGREIELNDNSIVYGYEGPQSQSDENVEIIGDAKAFGEWLKLNTPQNEEI